MMKTIITIIFVVAVCFVFLTACSDQSESTGQAVSPQQGASEDMEQTAETPMGQPETGMQEISGTVIRTEEGFALFTAENQYDVIGQDLSEFVGKNVKVTGTVEEQAGAQVIMVTSVAPIE